MIKALTRDLFGFSRGAAGARNFIHEALFEATSVALTTKVSAKAPVKTRTSTGRWMTTVKKRHKQKSPH
ncbi:MAG: hypothetical protein COB33_004890 [Thiotrichaceae bacterium]|nr:hypothetical protein [Thiotrichaceae bacterium]